MIKEYYEELKKYVDKVKKKIKYYWNHPNNEITEKIIRTIKNIGNKISEIFNNFSLYVYNFYLDFKEYLLRGDNRRKNLLTIGVFIILNLILLFSAPSFAIYQNNFEFSVLDGIVGDEYSNEFDYTLLVYVEDNTNTGAGTYNLTSNIPTFGYSYSGYSCENGSTLIYDEETKITSVTTNHKDICSIYFDLTSESDISIRIMLEDSPNSNTYTVTNKIPYYGYKYSHYECDNNSTLIYDSELHTASISSQEQEYCSIYFQKEIVDIEVKLFVEETYQTGDYIERVSIPSNSVYVLNENNSVCYSNNERVDADISYIDGNIEISTKEITNCKVYLDRENE